MRLVNKRVVYKLLTTAKQPPPCRACNTFLFKGSARICYTTGWLYGSTIDMFGQTETRLTTDSLGRTSCTSQQHAYLRRFHVQCAASSANAKNVKEQQSIPDSKYFAWAAQQGIQAPKLQLVCWRLITIPITSVLHPCQSTTLAPHHTPPPPPFLTYKGDIHWRVARGKSHPANCTR